MPKKLERAERAWERWSATKLQDFMACSLRGFFGHVLKIQKPQHPLAAFGQALHYTFDRFFTPHRSTKNYPYQEVDKLIGAWKGLWWMAVSGKHGFSGRNTKPVTVNWEDSEQPGKLFAWGCKILQMFFAQYHPVRSSGHTHFTERRFSFAWSGLQLTGIIDRIDITPGGARVLDYKGSALSDYQLATGLQMTIYQLAYDFCLQKQLPGQNPRLTKMQIYNYPRGQTQEVPLRTDYDFGLLLYCLLEASEYLRNILTGLPVRQEIIDHFRFFSEADIATGNITPRLPRGEHCKYCQYFPECREWELNGHVSPHDLFVQHRQVQLARIMPTQSPLPISAEPIVQVGASFATMIRQLPNYEQGNLFDTPRSP